MQGATGVAKLAPRFEEVARQALRLLGKWQEGGGHLAFASEDTAGSRGDIARHQPVLIEQLVGRADSA